MEIDLPDLIRLRELPRVQEKLTVEVGCVTTPLWRQLHRYYPQILAISQPADYQLMWTLLGTSPRPAEDAEISFSCVQRVLKAKRIRKFLVDEVLTALKNAPLVLAPGTAEAASEDVQLLLPEVKLLEQQPRDMGNRIKRLLSEMNDRTDQPSRDAGVVLSIPGVGAAVALAFGSCSTACVTSC